MAELQLPILPEVRITESRLISSVARSRLYPYLMYRGLNAYEMDFTIYDDNNYWSSLNEMMLSDKPVFFDFSDKISGLWGHLLLREIMPRSDGFRQFVDVAGLLIPSWGSVLGRTKNSAIAIGSSYSYFAGSPFWHLNPTIDTDNKTIQWEFTAYNPLMEVDYEIGWGSSIMERSGTGSYDWSYETTSSLNLGSQGYSVIRTSGTYSSYKWIHSTDGTSYAALDLTNVPFIHLSLKNKGTLEVRLYDTDLTEYRYTTFTGVYPIRQYTQNFHRDFTWSFNANGTTETDIDFSAVSTQMIMDGVEKLDLDRIGYTYGRPAIYEFRVPSYDASSTVTIETYNPSDSTWYTLIQFDPRHPEDYTPSLWNLKYNNGRSGPHIDGVKVLALYRLGTNGQLVSPVTYEDSKEVDLFPSIEYSNMVGYSFAIGLLLGPDDDDHDWSQIKLRITYPYDSLSLGEDYLGVVS